MAVAAVAEVAPVRAEPASDAAQTATARKLTAIRNQPLLLEAFLREMPKGGDLHNHLSGAIYAESYLRWAAEDRLCVSTTTMSIVVCNGTPGEMSAGDVFQNAAIYRSEEHTSELQSHHDLVCRLL